MLETFLKMENTIEVLDLIKFISTLDSDKQNFILGYIEGCKANLKNNNDEKKSA